jgi:hypothetical protein
VTLLAVSIVLGGIAAGWIIIPLVARRLATLGDAIPGGVIDAEARKRVALASLKEIEYDRIGGKLDDADYHALRQRLEREALLAMQAADGARRAAESFEITHACGFVNPPGSRFCSGCGNRLG